MLCSKVYLNIGFASVALPGDALHQAPPHDEVDDVPSGRPQLAEEVGVNATATFLSPLPLLVFLLLPLSDGEARRPVLLSPQKGPHGAGGGSDAHLRVGAEDVGVVWTRKGGGEREGGFQARVRGGWRGRWTSSMLLSPLSPPLYD